MSSSRLKSEEIYRERVASDSLFASNSKTSNSSNDQSQQQQARAHQQTPAEDVSEHEDVFGPPPLPKASDNLRAKSKVNSLFDDSDSGEDLFASASPSSRSLKSSEPTPSKVATAPASFSKQPAPDQQSKRLSLFDDDDDLFGPPRDAPDVDLFGAAPVKSLAKVTDGLFDSVDEAVGLSAEEKPKVADLFAEKPAPVADGSFAGKGKSEKKPATSDALVAEKVAKEPSLSKEPTKPVLETSKSGARGLFDDDDSDLFSKASKPSAETEKAGSSFTGSSKSLFEDTADSDLFGSSSKNLLDKNIPIEKSSDGLFSNVAESSDLFAKAAEQKPAKKEPVKDLFEDKLTKSKKLSSSIFDDSDDEDLFGGSSLNKKKASSSIFEDDKRMEGEKKPEDTSMRSKQVEKSSIFEDDDDDDLFGDKKKKPTEKKEVASENEKSTEEAKKENNEAEPESKPKTEQDAKPELAPKKAMFAEIRQKLEKHKLLEPEEERSAKPAAESSSVVDGAVSSKREPPKSLKIQLPLPKELSSNGDKHPAVPKKPVVSGKIKNLMGKMGDLKILSPTDTPPLFRKNPSEDKSSNEDEQEPLTADSEASSEPSTPASLPSGGSSPQNSGTNSKARDSPSLKSDNTEAAISFDEPAQVETLATASKSRARIPAKRRPQSRQARHSALRHSGIDFDAIDTATSPNQPNGDTSDAVDRLMPSGRSQETGHNLDNDKSELSASRNTTTNLLSPSTDEEDLFDVPPDLPEDPAVKEDSLFGRAPILSPIETIAKTAKNSESAKKESAERKAGDSRVKRIKKDEKQEDERNKGDEKKKGIEDKNDKIAEPTDPLRDENHDPLKDPSQLFAFVTKTPSPEKNKGLLLSEDDDSLFSSSSKTVEKPLDARPKPTLDLFNDDDDASGNDLFSSSKSKLKKKPLKDTKIDLFDADSPEDDDDSLFGSTTKKKRDTAPASNIVAKAEEKPESKSTKTTTKDIFNDSSDDEDIFAGNKKAIPKKTSKSLFDDEEDDDNGDIFGKPKSLSLKDSKSAAANDRPVVKKAVTRDLKKTAEKIVEDPLSMLQDE